MKLDLLGNIKGVNVLCLNLESNSIHTKFNEIDLFECSPELFPLENYGMLFRSVSFDRLEDIKLNGVDVSPTDAAIFCDDLEKASEYGEWPKVVMGFDLEMLDRTYRQVDSTIPKAELAFLQTTFPTLETSVDGSKIWLSRLPYDSGARTKPYEANYGYWIPGNPWDALRVIILADLNERDWPSLSEPSKEFRTYKRGAIP
jgi:hypothetical protein